MDIPNYQDIDESVPNQFYHGEPNRAYHRRPDQSYDRGSGPLCHRGPNGLCNRESKQVYHGRPDPSCSQGPNQLYDRVPDQLCNRESDLSCNRWPDQLCNRGPNQLCDRGPNQLGSQGPNRLYDGGPNQLCNQGPNRLCNQGPNQLCNRGPNRLCNQGPNQLCDRGLYEPDNEEIDLSYGEGPTQLGTDEQTELYATEQTDPYTDSCPEECLSESYLSPRNKLLSGPTIDPDRNQQPRNSFVHTQHYQKPSEKTITNDDILAFILKKYNIDKRRIVGTIFKIRVNKIKEHIINKFYLDNPRILKRKLRDQYIIFTNWNKSNVIITETEFEYFHDRYHP